MKPMKIWVTPDVCNKLHLLSTVYGNILWSFSCEFLTEMWQHADHHPFWALTRFHWEDERCWRSLWYGEETKMIISRGQISNHETVRVEKWCPLIPPAQWHIMHVIFNIFVLYMTSEDSLFFFFFLSLLFLKLEWYVVAYCTWMGLKSLNCKHE